MITSASGPQRLYLMQVATMIVGPLTLPVPCYLIQTRDGKNILIDSGFPLNFQPLPNTPGLQRIEHEKGVIEQLATIDVRSSDIDLLICTHYDDDHAGNHGAFPNARLIAQRLQHEVASAGHPRFALTRSQWDQPASRYQLVDGDTQLLPGLELIETSGHVPGHQAVLVHLPQTGSVLLAIDAVAIQAHFTADRPVGPTDADGAGAIASTRKLLNLAERKHLSLVIFGHDGSQWSTLKQLPDFFD
ncbi:MBL fold metallo-hydrolase [Ktedonobacter sp. SOSP1-52]|uniref:N-acyl homoserine lactonase family protein n=1 Tax=Ktedonobacter sp. SOSP1-52 TaxID=2778366 RepID=UPI00191576A9|nr:N-acyl homoserine lactonase family protein [Ktedonobacter sp. SOSP1-52]GHO61711.1 MBL fold metallo-hydrolase [Ktedonobacter sp. SOSP1-52]